MKYPLATTSWDDAEVQAGIEVLKSGFCSMGQRVKDLELAFAQFFGSPYAVMVNSGSSANLLMIAALFYTKKNPLKQGDEVIVPAVSWPTTYYPLYQYGLKLKFVDIDLETLNFNLSALENAVSEKTRAILCVNLLGNPNDFVEIEKIISGKNIYLLEDNCESMGAEYKDRKAGTFGTMGTFSTFFSHHMSTMEGGMVCTDDEELYHIMLSLRAHGWTRNLPEKNQVTGSKSSNPFEEAFRFVLPGYNIRPLEIEAAIGLEQLKKLPGFLEQRRKNALTFKSSFLNHPNIIIQKELGESSWFGFSLVLKNKWEKKRSNIVKHLMDTGIEVRPIVAGNFTKNEVMKYFQYEISGNVINSDYIDTNGFFVGNSHEDLSSEIKYLSRMLESVGEL